MRRFLRDSDRGVSLTELALLMPLLLILAIGTFEYGMLFRDTLVVSTAAREAGRVAASSANYGDADCVILEAASGALQSLQTGTTAEVHIYKSDANGSIPPDNDAFMRRYRPAVPMEPGLIACGTSDWIQLSPGSSWDPVDRVNDAGSADWIGVRVRYIHDFQLNVLWFDGTQTLDDDAVFRIEPPAP